MVVVGYNDLGMHCMNQDFSEFMILPPFNVLHAQVIDRRGEDPRIVTDGVTVKYALQDTTVTPWGITASIARAVTVAPTQ